MGLVLASLPAGATPASGVAPPASLAACAWPLQVGADATNAFLPDSAATYWVTPYVVRQDLRITLSGTFPDARYFSLNIYPEAGGLFTRNGVESGLPDFRVVPNPGSANPWQRVSKAGGRYEVTVRSDVAHGQPNILPLAPEGTPDGAVGHLVYRVYLPTTGNFSDVPLPTITLTHGGTSTTLSPCGTADPPAAGSRTDFLKGPPADVVAPHVLTATELSFVRLSEHAIFPNPDNAYLTALAIPPTADEVVVIRAKAPREVVGKHPSPWPATRADLRYWSLCTNLLLESRPVVVNPLPGGDVDYGCRHDAVTRVDWAGYYTYVLGREDQRAAIEAVRGVTFVPFSSARPSHPHLVLFRTMLPAEGFTRSVHHVPADDRADSAAEVMGPYYPRAVRCSLESLARRGGRGCFQPVAS